MYNMYNHYNMFCARTLMENDAESDRIDMIKPCQRTVPALLADKSNTCPATTIVCTYAHLEIPPIKSKESHRRFYVFCFFLLEKYLIYWISWLHKSSVFIRKAIDRLLCTTSCDNHWWPLSIY